MATLRAIRCELVILVEKLCMNRSKGISYGKEFVCSAGDLGLIPGLGSSPREGNGNPFQYSCLKNPTDKAWWATVHGVAKSLT